MARSIGQRVIALVLAFVFLATSVGIGLLVAWQAFSGNDNNNNGTNTEQQVLTGTQLESFDPVENVAELKVTDIQEGEGKETKATDTVVVDYTGALASNGVIFESSKDTGQPVSFPLQGVIKGWSEGLVGMKEGGVRRLLIPAELAYGDNPPPGSNIPPGAALVFDVTLYAVTPTEGAE